MVGVISPTDRHGLDALDFCNMSGCEQLVRCPTHLTEVLGIVNVVIGTPLGNYGNHNSVVVINKLRILNTFSWDLFSLVV